MPELGFLPRHARLLVALAQRPEVRNALKDAKSVLETPLERKRFVRLARELGVEGLALSALRASEVAQSLSAVVQREFAARWEELQRQAMVWDLERERVLHALNRSGISAILLKGSALRELIFREPAERSMGDLDLLVASADRGAAMRALQEAGYATDSPDVMEAFRQHHFHYTLTHPRGFIVELHWALSEPGSATALDAADFTQRAVSKERSGATPVRVPSPEDLLIHVVSQNADDAFGLLRRVVDLDRIMARWPQLDWEYVLDASRQAHLDLVLAVSLRLAERMMHTAVPTSVTERLQLPAVSRFHLALLQPVAWVVSLPSRRRHVAFEAMRLWTTLDGRDRLRGLASIARGSDPLMDARERSGSIERTTTRRTGTGVMRLTKLGLFHLSVYARSGIAAATPTGRDRLRFWRAAAIAPQNRNRS